MCGRIWTGWLLKCGYSCVTGLLASLCDDIYISHTRLQSGDHSTNYVFGSKYLSSLGGTGGGPLPSVPALLVPPVGFEGCWILCWTAAREGVADGECPLMTWINVIWTRIAGEWTENNEVPEPDQGRLAVRSAEQAFLVSDYIPRKIPVIFTILWCLDFLIRRYLKRRNRWLIRLMWATTTRSSIPM